MTKNLQLMRESTDEYAKQAKIGKIVKEQDGGVW